MMKKTRREGMKRNSGNNERILECYNSEGNGILGKMHGTIKALYVAIQDMKFSNQATLKILL